MSVANNIKASPAIASQNAYWPKVAIVPKWPSSASTPRIRPIHQVMTFGGVSFIFYTLSISIFRRGPTYVPGVAGSDNLQNGSSQTRESCNRMLLIIILQLILPGRIHRQGSVCLRHLGEGRRSFSNPPLLLPDFQIFRVRPAFRRVEVRKFYR
jgi:hypothetical protein